MRAQTLVVLLTLMGCAHGSTVGPEHDSRETITSESVATRTQLPETRPYSTHVPRGSVLLAEGGAARSTQETLARACRKAGLEPDPRLSELARAIAGQSDQGRKAPRGALVGYLAHRLGLPEPTPQLWLASASRVEMLLPELDRAVHEAAASQRLTHCGGAQVQSGDTTVLAVAFSGRFLALKKDVAERVPLGASVLFDASLHRSFAQPSLAVTDPRGQVVRIALPKGRSVQHRLQLDRPGEYSIELLAEGPEGVSVIAVLPVLVGDGTGSPAPDYEEGATETDVAGFTERLEELINQSRTARGLTPLIVNRRLTRIALAHSEDMDAHHFVGHTSRATGEATDRLARAGLKAKVLLENIGRGYSASEIHDGLMSSPGHRANILHPAAREMGLGVVMQREGERHAFLVTEVFAELLK